MKLSRCWAYITWDTHTARESSNQPHAKLDIITLFSYSTRAYVCHPFITTVIDRVLKQLSTSNSRLWTGTDYKAIVPKLCGNGGTSQGRIIIWIRKWHGGTIGRAGQVLHSASTVFIRNAGFNFLQLIVNCYSGHR